ncbi:hypothetical protein UCD39_03105 [Nitrospirillum sp. BR 11752]|uniref:hypothetical protein n=1 Tax=Nitrospirillum sp. BR 11752 TaxID=3104293 RepID=UPI002E9C87FC|nr:hypothetical protein [Nitrospirillum sp. BR 11752]
MKIVNLKNLRVGDVILETGIRKIASATDDGRYGHASIALGRLIKMETGVEKGAVIAPFDAEIFSMGSDTIIGSKYDHEVLVRRPKK